jgi:hypothetical protein
MNESELWQKCKRELTIGEAPVEESTPFDPIYLKTLNYVIVALLILTTVFFFKEIIEASQGVKSLIYVFPILVIAVINKIISHKKKVSKSELKNYNYNPSLDDIEALIEMPTLKNYKLELINIAKIHVNSYGHVTESLYSSIDSFEEGLSSIADDNFYSQEYDSIIKHNSDYVSNSL